MKRTLKIVITTLVLGLGINALAAPDEEVRRYRAHSESQVIFVIHESKDPIFPMTLRRKGYDEGTAIFAIYVNQFGELADYLLLEASHLDFAEAVERVLPDWEYSVPLLGGETAAIVSTVKVKFKRGSGVVYETSGYENIQTQLGTFTDYEDAYRTYTPKELDSILIPTHIEKPAFHVELLEDRNLVNAVFEFYIDTDGNVRIPTLREADDEVDERLLIIAQEALLQWKFEPPRRNGVPVVARTALPFRFKKKGYVGSLE
ncbi:hypothetical protein VDG1235_3513 [Verrucomicrobiia bacterium DG1235]|nr:hypothetical protein VDG1235_3513 [Verrucomicrobiae bacterium DG1235]